ncbi:MAG: hypothetical protein AAF960_14775 [Bacteroidota bacterium]
MNPYQILFYLFLLATIGLVAAFLWYVRTTRTKIDNQEKSLRHLQEVQDRLSLVLGQELRKPILTFRGLSRKIDFLLDAEEYIVLSKLGGQLEAEAVKLTLLCENVLSWSQIHEGSAPYQLKPIAVKDILYTIESIYQPLASQKNILLQTKLDTAAHVSADFDSLMLILKNLMQEALQTVPEKETILLDVQSHANTILFQLKYPVSPSFCNISSLSVVEAKPTDLAPQKLHTLLSLNRAQLQRNQLEELTHIQVQFPRA